MTVLRAAQAALISVFMASVAAAQDITLTSHDGKVEVSGTMLGYDGEFYRVETTFGELTVDGSGVTCDGPACPNLTDFVAELRFSGSAVLGETVLPALIVGFARQEGLTATPTRVDEHSFTYALLQPGRDAPLGRFYFQLGTTDQGFADVTANTADIALALREINPDEQAAAAEAGLGPKSTGLRPRVIALDALVPVVAKSNPVDQISLSDLALVFAGQITNWSELGGPDAPIALHLPDEHSGPGQAASAQILAQRSGDLSENIVRHSTSRALVRAIANDPFALGITSQSQAGTVARALSLAGGCGHTLAATRQSIKSEDYPLTSPMFLYLPPRRLPRLARQFLAYTQSETAQMVIREAGLVDQMPELQPIGLQGDRLANAISAGTPEVGLEELTRLIETLRPMSRLSLSFRFEPGSSRPDAQSRSNIERLAQALESGAFDTKKLTFVGFSDGDGSASANARIASLRAKTVRNAVVAAIDTTLTDSVEISVDGFGEAMPMACDDTEWGRKVNRRVEVWVQ